MFNIKDLIISVSEILSPSWGYRPKVYLNPVDYACLAHEVQEKVTYTLEKNKPIIKIMDCPIIIREDVPRGLCYVGELFQSDQNEEVITYVEKV